MRRALFGLLAGVLAGWALPGAAQAQEILLGAKIGASFSKFSDDGDFDAGVSNLANFIGGGYARVLFGRFGVQPEILAVTKGAEFDLPGDNDFELKIDYVEVPILGVVTFRYPRVSPYLMAGPTFAIEVRCKTEFNNGDADVMFDCDDVEAEPTIFARESLDIGAAIGAGMLIAVGPGAALVEARYTHGFTNINDSEFDDSTIKNRSIYLMAGYAYPLRRR